jgi:hypothetical protein
MVDGREKNGHRFESIHRPSTRERAASEFTGYWPASEGPTVCAIAGLTGFGTNP